MRLPSILASCALIAMLTLTCGCGQTPAPTQAETAEPVASDQGETASSAGENQELNQAIQQPLDKARALEGRLQDDRDATDQSIDDQSD